MSHVILKPYRISNIDTNKIVYYNMKEGSTKKILYLNINLFGTELGPFVTIVGILPWPIVFLLTDLLNEFYGYKAVKRLSWITAILIAYCFIIVGLAIQIPAYEIEGSSLSDDYSFNKVFGQAQMVIVGSICAFLVSQLLDAVLFKWIKSKKKTVIGYGVTAKSTTILNYCKIGKNYISYFVDTTLDKQNKYTPGTKIPIYKYENITHS